MLLDKIKKYAQPNAVFVLLVLLVIMVYKCAKQDGEKPLFDDDNDYIEYVDDNTEVERLDDEIQNIESYEDQFKEHFVERIKEIRNLDSVNLHREWANFLSRIDSIGSPGAKDN